MQPDWFEVTRAGVGTNRYAYSGNDPVNALDPGGNFWRLIKSGVKSAWRGGRDTVRDVFRGDFSLRRTGQNFRNSGVDEIAGAADSAYTLVAPNTTVADRGFAAVDLVTGINLGGKRAVSGLDAMLRRDGTVYDGPGGQRLPQDEFVNPNAPAPMGTNRPIGQSPTQNAEAQRTVRELRDLGAEDIRINQQQIDIVGNRVGINRPDIQFTLDGRRGHIEFDRSPATRAIPHAQRIRSNDPYSFVWLRTIE